MFKNKQILPKSRYQRIKLFGDTMTLPIFKERRMDSRRTLTGLLPASIVLKEEPEQKFSCKPVDISPDGLGVLADIVLPVGTELLLKLPDEDIVMKIIWKKQDFSKKELFRYGLVTASAQHDIEKIFEEHGCFK